MTPLRTLIAAASFLAVKPETGTLLFIDDLNIVFVVVNAFVGFTTSVFSATYIGHEIDDGRLTPPSIAGVLVRRYLAGWYDTHAAR